MVFRVVVLQMRMRSPLFWLQMRFCLKLPQVLYYMSANSKGSGETALMRRLARAFVGRLCDKYPFPMCWLEYRCLEKQYFARMYSKSSLMAEMYCYKWIWDNMLCKIVMHAY